jgi:hypothetical protein
MAKLDWFNYLDVNIWEFLRDYGDKPEHKIRGEPFWEGGIFKKEIVPLSIPWALPDEIIVDYFRQFLEVYRPQGDDQRPRVDAPRFRGKTGGAGSEPRQHRAVLKALGAWRLYQHYDGNFVKASLNREAMVFLGKQYELAGPWYHAKKTVQSVLRQFQSEIDRAIREKP